MKKSASFVIALLLTLSAFGAMNYVRASGQVSYTNASADVTTGGVIVLDNQHGIALVDIASNATGIVAIEGVFDLTLATNCVVTLNETLYWDVSEDECTTNTSGNAYIGLATEAKTTVAATTLINVDLNANDAK